ncbi:MAG TPA: PQQ-dependent sugar dehydrogenase [Bryobacteraceae bacterium]|jgi:glucose/arabinose dehydrogenase
MLRLTSLLLVAACALPAQTKVPDLPAPFATPDARNPPKVIARPDAAKLSVPAGFKVKEYASGFSRPRFMLEGPGGEVLITESTAKGSVTVLTDGGKSRKKLIEGLDRPYGLALRNSYLYVGEPTSIKRYKYDSKTMTAGPGEEIISLKGYSAGHVTRSLQFDPKGEYLYAGIGSSADHVVGDPENRAAITRYHPDGSGMELVASGTRNPIGLKFNPKSGQLWAAVQERDHVGDDLVPDYFTSIRSGGFYGWPYAYIGPHEDPRTKGQRSDLVAKTIVPDVVLQPHSAVLDFTFYTGKAFPAEYRGGAFLAFHGSSNRSKRLGYAVAFVPFKNGKPSGPARDFMSGWMLSPDEKEVWGRPVAVLELKDGSLLISDDGGNKVWRISYR